MKKLNITFGILIISTQVFASAAEKTAPVIPNPSIGLSTTEVLIIALLLFAAVLLLVTVILFNAFKVMIKVQADPSPFKKYEAPEALPYEEWLKQKRSKPNIWTKLLSLKPIEQEADMTIPHAYDGIHELDNPVPRWFNVLFYGTMIFAVGYIYYYHFADGPRQDQEYETEMAKATEDKRLFLAKAGEKYDENSVKVDPALVANGKAVFLANCIACHGEQGQGIVGPNLVDEYWLHGGSINDVFKTVKYGVPAKGMASWEKNLSAKNIAEVVNFIESLKGTHPANAKAPQGEKYEAKLTTDTTKNETTPKG
ncbi:MAG: c-type cytochrome [Pedobacter sp.]|nr:MAG: c-type cytochrome [Pedobacter sp.]